MPLFCKCLKQAILICLLLICGFSFALQANTLADKPAPFHLIIHTESMVPYNFYGQNNEIIGVNAEITKAILKHANISSEFHLLPWARAYKATLEVANSGLISTAKTTEREALFKWVGPLASGNGYLYKLKSREDIKVSSIEEAKQYMLAVIRGDIYQTIFEKQGFKLGKNLILFGYNSEYMKPFLHGKVDLILGSDLVMPYLLMTANSNINVVEPVAPLPTLLGNYLALNKNTPDFVVKKLNKALLKMKKSGEFQKIIDKYKYPKMALSKN